jgi:hypothetical protein
MTLTIPDYFTLPVAQDGNNGTIIHWCAPAYGAVEWCLPTDLMGFAIHNWIGMSVNFATALFLATAIAYVRFVKQRDITKKLYFRLALFCLLSNYFDGLWCLLRNIPGVPEPVVGLAFGIKGGLFTLPGVHNFLLSWQEIRTNESLMVYSGLRMYKLRWIINSAISATVFLVLMPLSGASQGLYYEISMRIFNGFFLMETAIICAPGIIHGYKLIKEMEATNNTASPNQAKLILVVLVGMCLIGCPLMLVGTITPMLFDRITWLWHIYYGTLEMSIDGFSLLLSVWMFRVAAYDNSINSSRSDTSIKISYSLSNVSKLNQSTTQPKTPKGNVV